MYRLSLSKLVRLWGFSPISGSSVWRSELSYECVSLFDHFPSLEMLRPFWPFVLEWMRNDKLRFAYRVFRRGNQRLFKVSNKSRWHYTFACDHSYFVFWLLWSLSLTMVASVYTQHYRDVRVIWMLEPDGHEKISIFGGYRIQNLISPGSRIRAPNRRDPAMSAVMFASVCILRFVVINYRCWCAEAFLSETEIDLTIVTLKSCSQ